MLCKRRWWWRKKRCQPRRLLSPARITSRPPSRNSSLDIHEEEEEGKWRPICVQPGGWQLNTKSLKASSSPPPSPVGSLIGCPTVLRAVLKYRSWNTLSMHAKWCMVYYMTLCSQWLSSHLYINWPLSHRWCDAFYFTLVAAYRVPIISIASVDWMIILYATLTTRHQDFVMLAHFSLSTLSNVIALTSIGWRREKTLYVFFFVFLFYC